MNLEWIGSALPWLFILACPLVMLWCMRGMSGKSCDEKATGAGGSELGVVASGGRDEEIALLRARLARLEAQHEKQEPWK